MRNCVAACVVVLAVAGSAWAGETPAPKVAFFVEGQVGGADIASAEHAMAAARLEGFLDTKFKEMFGTANFDKSALAKARADKEAWSVVAGGDVAAVQAILKEAKLDALIRVYFRTAPAYKAKDKDGNPLYAGTATVMAEVIDLASGEKGAFLWSPPMGALDTGATEAVHTAKHGRDAFSAGMAALEYAAAQLAKRMEKDDDTRVLLGKQAPAPAVADPLRVVFLIDGRIRGQGVSDREQRVGAKRLEASLSRQLKSILGLRNFDEALMKQARKDKEQYAVLAGGNVEDVQALLEQLKVDAVIRVLYRTADAYKKRDPGGNTIYSGTASMTAQIIRRETGAKSEVVLSPTMGTVEHPARRALDAFDAGVSALDYATGEMLKQLQASPSFLRLKDRNATAVETGMAPKKKVLFVLEGSIGGDHLVPLEQRVGAMRLETMLDRKLRGVLGLESFDATTLKTVRQNAEEWAVLLGDDAAAVQGVLEKHNVDSIVRVTYATTPAFAQKDKDGNAIYSATADVKATVVGRASGVQEEVIAAPKMGTDTHRAKMALDPFDAGMAALSYATDRMAERLKVSKGVVAMMGGALPTAAATAPAAVAVKPKPSKPTVAVLWIRPEFGYWKIPRSRQPGLNRKKRKKMKQFVDHVRSTGSIGAEVAHFLVQGIVASGALLPVENSKKSQAEMAAVQNKILEYRMAGWVKGKLSITDPVTLSRDLGADYVVTAKITKIYEHATSRSALFVSAGKQTGFAEVELIITDVKTGQTKQYAGKGSFSKTGFGTFMTFEPQNMAMDRMMIGGAIKEALFNAAKQIALD